MTSLLSRTTADRPGTMSAMLTEAWMRDIEVADARVDTNQHRPAHEMDRTFRTIHKRNSQTKRSRRYKQR